MDSRDSRDSRTSPNCKRDEPKNYEIQRPIFHFHGLVSAHSTASTPCFCSKSKSTFRPMSVRARSQANAPAAQWDNVSTSTNVSGRRVVPATRAADAGGPKGTRWHPMPRPDRPLDILHYRRSGSWVPNFPGLVRRNVKCQNGKVENGNAIGNGNGNGKWRPIEPSVNSGKFLDAQMQRDAPLASGPIPRAESQPRR